MIAGVRKLVGAVALSTALGLSSTAWAAEDEFVIRDIRLEGLQGIASGTVFTYLPVDIGDSFSLEQSAEVARALYATGFFSDISIRRLDDVLIIVLEERPAVNAINITGNRDIKTDQLLNALRQVGLAPGRVFNRTVLERVENELLQQYFARGKYNVNIDVKVEDLPRNRVDVSIEIAEGRVARIQQVRVVGNEAYSEKNLTRRLESGLRPWYNPLSRRDRYSKQRLAGDLEELRSFYLDSGFVNFSIDSTQVSLTPDRRDIYVTINIDEGEQYRVREVKLAGELVVSEQELMDLLLIGPGDIFSRSKITNSATAISRRLGDEGYAFANVNPIPELDEETREVSLTLFVDPGRRVYVRRINFTGNSRTQDEVFRREMRQMEGGWFSASNIDRSRIRLQRLPYVENITLETKPVPGSDDQVDIDVSVTERLSGSFMVGLGYAQSDGVLFNLSLSQDNFFGTGNRVAAAFNNSRINTLYSFSYTNPYYTINGVSRGFTAFYRETDATEAEISRYSSNRMGAAVTYGIPLTEFNTFGITPGVEKVEILTSTNTPVEINDFLTDNDGPKFTSFSLGTNLTHDTRDRTIFATRGTLQSGGLEFTLPGSDLEYYKIDYRGQYFRPLRENLTLKVHGEFSLGDAYGDTTDLPFFEKFFAGGTRSVRGFKDFSLGPRDSNNDPFGGNFRVMGGTELIFPPPFMDEMPNLRMSLFLDAGQVFADYNDFDAGDIRYSVGVGMSWLSPVGALTFSLAQAINDEPDDRLQTFQFNIGASF